MMNNITAIICTNRKSDLLSLSSMVTVVVEDVKLSVTPGGSLEASWAVNC